MASQFVGCTVVVTLKDPPNAQVKGIVANVIGRSLSLQNVCLWNGQQLPIYQIEADSIADLTLSSVPRPTATAPAPAPAPAPFQDPAIVSMKKPVAPAQKPAQKPAQSVKFPEQPVVSVPSAAPSSASQTLAPPPPPPPTFLRRDGTETPLTKSIEHLTLKEKPNGGESRVSAAPRPRTRGANRSAKLPGHAHIKANRAGDSGGSSAANKKADYTGKGWRHTPLIEPAEAPDSPAVRKIRPRKARKNLVDDPNGWATEDATDIQELGDFDFASNLSKFDKGRVFDEIRSEDKVRKEDRLVSFNRRVARPGTNGGKNLHYTENVLDMDDDINEAALPNKWNREADETEEEESEEEGISSGRGSRRPRSRASQRARKGSAVIASSLLSRGSLGSRNASPRPGQSASPRVPRTGSLWLTTTNRYCPCISPLQMIELEQLAIGEIGLSEEILAENAGRGIAEAAVTRASELAASSTILVFAGNHKTGIRAACAVRHLRNRGYRVTLCILGLDREEELFDGLKKQIQIVKKVGARVSRWQDLATSLSATDYVPDLIIDALFGIHVTYEDLRSDDQASVFDIISWANRSNIEIMSVDIPSGRSATSGEISQGSNICIEANLVVCLGAPKIGLLQALDSEACGEWQLFVLDVGISQVAWRKFGTRRRHGVDFGNSWIAPMKYQPASS
ncbi:YjeF_N domain-containing protein [Ascosphaera apis ARSEF 7405]|uniref:Enhancer of mRNA-decapping protein 3 n=1 Tax=Ascosphaera apis ARSEF 7405 TaxID=392613 RepID=A0A168C8P0_9EURO|nr:YjeF_N domain-containing protein [Ascosphaera apis ARSEF 7405]